MSHSDGEILQIVILDLKEVLQDKDNRLSDDQINLLQISISELSSLLSNWGPILKLFRFGNKYRRE
jgi:hypothetical protein